MPFRALRIGGKMRNLQTAVEERGVHRSESRFRVGPSQAAGLQPLLMQDSPRGGGGEKERKKPFPLATALVNSCEKGGVVLLGVKRGPSIRKGGWTKE